MTIKRLWAKSAPYHPLLAHCIDVGLVAGRLLTTEEHAHLPERWREATGCPAPIPWLSFLAACHDIGKATTQFQTNCHLPRHEYVTASHLNRWFKEWRWNVGPRLTVTNALAMHHAREVGGEIPPLADSKQYRDALLAQLLAVFNPPEWAPQAFPDASTAGLILAGLTVYADWIASNEQIFSMGQSVLDYRSWVPARQADAERAVERLGLNGGRHLHSGSYKALFPKVFKEGTHPSPIQEGVATLCASGQPGLTIIEAPMGEGKTEAALYMVNEWVAQGFARGFFIGLPTGATANAMHTRVREFLLQATGDPDVRLVHSLSFLLEGYQPNYSQDRDMDHWFLSSRRALLDQYGVGTVDQAMMGVLPNRFAFLRLFGLIGKVLVIDEVHAYDAYMSEIIDTLLQWCGALRIPTILLSATLPSNRRNMMVQAYSGRGLSDEGAVAYPLITHVGWDGAPPRSLSGFAPRRTAAVNVEMIPLDLRSVDVLARRITRQTLAEGGVIGVVVNTVDDAQRLFDVIHAELQGSVDVRIFHSRYRAADRYEIEEALIRDLGAKSGTRPRTCIVIATQVVEQSIDIDFDRLYTVICPIDLLLQRVGRLHRHKRDHRPTGPEPWLHLLVPEKAGEYGQNGRVYHPAILASTQAILAGKDRLTLPGEIRPLVEDVYCNLDLTKEEIQAYLTKCGTEAAIAAGRVIRPHDPGSFHLGQDTRSPHPDDPDSEYMSRTRLGDTTERVLLLLDDRMDQDLTDTYPGVEVHREVLGNMVPLPKSWLGSTALEIAPRWLHRMRIIRPRRDGISYYQGGARHRT